MSCRDCESSFPLWCHAVDHPNGGCSLACRVRVAARRAGIGARAGTGSGRGAADRAGANAVAARRMGARHSDAGTGAAARSDEPNSYIQSFSIPDQQLLK